MLVGAGKVGAWCWGICFEKNNGRTVGRYRGLSWFKNNAPILDNSYEKCYNKRSDNNKKAISHQTGKNGPIRRFCFRGYNFMPMA